MDLILMEASALLLLAVAIWVFRRRWATLGIFNPATFERLEQVERNAQQTKQSCSSALADIQKNLASLEQRTVAAEQKLASHGAAPAGQHKEFYHAAALLLYAGHPAARVADVLDLSLAQVEMVRELQKMIAAENPLDAAQESQVANYTSDKTPKRKNPMQIAQQTDPADGYRGSGKLRCRRRRPTGGDEWGSRRTPNG